MIKYRENMTDAELEEFIKEIDALHKAYDDAFKKNYHVDYDDENTILRKAALNSKGQP